MDKNHNNSGTSWGMPAHNTTSPSSASSDSASPSSSPTADAATHQLDEDGGDPNSPAPNVASICPRLKLAYEKCFQSWYTNQFLTGDSQQLPCEPEFVRYNACVRKRLDPDVLKEVAGLAVNGSHWTSSQPK